MVLAISTFGGCAGRHVAIASCAHIVGGEDLYNTRCLQGRCGIDAADGCVRMVGAQHMRIQLARQIPVGGVAAFAGHQPQVFVA